eukprot:TRINITY_DN7554_c0_g1_i1.p1 TRINITY_DN7554_c0_g1~~TRINITY_DN7554_c0_g1_i1.p1  ORF type:complete len:230 (+),score=36.10 TRINITY_DN7554_c0_g1_i1:23-712(+)
MPIYYSCVTRVDVLLAEHSLQRGNYSDFVNKIRQQVPFTEGSRMSYSYDRYIFHYWIKFGLMFLCVADEHFGTRIPVSYLEAIQKKWRTSYGDKGATALEYAMQSEFSRVMKQQMDYFSNDINADKIRQVEHGMNQVKENVVSGIEKLLERGERIELLMDKTDQLQANSFQIRNRSAALKRAMWWKNAKMTILIVVIVIILLYIIFAAACGFPVFQVCFASAENTTLTN